MMESMNLHKSTQPVFLSNGGGKRDLNSFEKNLRSKLDIRIVEMPNGCWAIDLKFAGETEEYAVVTNPGVPKLWRNLGGAMMFVDDNCPNVGDVIVDVMKWRLRRLAEHCNPPQIGMTASP